MNGDGGVDFYFVPTLLIELLEQKIISANKVEKRKNQWGILVECQNLEFVKKTFRDFYKKS